MKNWLKLTVGVPLERVLVARQQLTQCLPRRNAAPLNLVRERLDVIGLPGGPPVFKLVDHLADDRVDALLRERRMDGLLL